MPLFTQIRKQLYRILAHFIFIQVFSNHLVTAFSDLALIVCCFDIKEENAMHVVCQLVSKCGRSS